ncbi:ADP-ribosylation [Amniculicola lignicola CBS 123094]|uniref:ADP-ribosylation n=1 Tax=Amniculicola lignicola CBS 123094 TaxID=1392246 RepID=A0A6A5WN56_9PLEO|nr:ADP-ribosylation [Amniculicola lignicola CBS 123094]
MMDIASERCFDQVRGTVSDEEYTAHGPIPFLSLEEQRFVDNIDEHLPPELNYRGYTHFGQFKFDFDEFTLVVTTDLCHDQPVGCRLDADFDPEFAPDYALSRKSIDGLRVALRSLLAEELKAHTKETPLNIQTCQPIILRMLQQALDFIRKYRQENARKVKENYWDVSTLNNINPLLDRRLKMVGVDLDTIQGAATHILGKSPTDICQGFPEGWRILHCENILRADLRNKFLLHQQDLREKLMGEPIEELRKCVPRELRRLRSDKEQLVEYLTEPRLSFHGTRQDLVPSIVQHGFLKPGDIHPKTGKALTVYNGSVYGQGIYSSPEAWYALLYSDPSDNTRHPSQLPGLKLIVCATVMGRAATMLWEDNWMARSEPYPGADSHVNGGQLAYIVFNSAQILPCYVLHLDWEEQDDTQIFNFVSQFSNSYNPSVGRKNFSDEGFISTGDLQRQKQERLAKGRKFFAYGFGPITGDRIVIEEVADYDDDEEDYGDYQAQRVGGETAKTNIWDWGNLEGETAVDEYTIARKSKINRRHPAV